MKKYELKELIKDKVTYEVRHHESSDAIEGNCSAINDEEDAKTTKWIRDELRNGNTWAWCDVEVACILRLQVEGSQHSWQGTDWLGCCSYESEKDFMTSGYVDGMKDDALDDLVDMIWRDALRLQALGFQVSL